MSRIRTLSDAEMDPALLDRTSPDSALAQTLGHRPNWLIRYLDEHQPTMLEGTIERETKELVRLLIAQYTRCKI